MKKWIAALFTSASLGGGVMYGDARINPYEDKGTHYELPIKSDIPQGERVEIAKGRAEMTIKGWNDEYAIKVIPQIPGPTFGADKLIERPFTAAADRPLFSKKMEYRHGDVTAFIEPRANTENEFDIDFTLHSKPDTNVFTYKIEGAEEFDFFYQSELTAQEITEGASRPENVVGSYAVYHKEKANHRVGSTNYATGKAFHVYRPKAIDANGAETWADLSYTDGVLSVTVPTRWLEAAAYPVVVDPTFGYTTIGATSANSSDIKGSIFAVAEDANVTSITSYSISDSGSKAAAIYSDNSGSPNSLLAEDAGNVSITSGVDWDTLTITASLSAGSYWLVHWTTSSTNSYSYDAGSANQNVTDSGNTFETWPNPSSPNTFFARKQSIYATYTISGGEASTTPEEYTIIYD